MLQSLKRNAVGGGEAFVALFSFAYKMDFWDTCLVGISLREERIDGSQESRSWLLGCSACTFSQAAPGRG